MGDYQDIHLFNRQNTEGYNDKILSYARWSQDEKLIIVSNFDAEKSYNFELQLPKDLVTKLELNENEYIVKDQLYNNYNINFKT